MCEVSAINEIAAISARDCFAAFLELFGKVWPALAIVTLCFAAYIIGILLRELWHATIGRFLDAEEQCADRNIDEQCGHDWNPKAMIADEIDES